MAKLKCKMQGCRQLAGLTSLCDKHAEMITVIEIGRERLEQQNSERLLRRCRAKLEQVPADARKVWGLEGLLQELRHFIKD